MESLHSDKSHEVLTVRMIGIVYHEFNESASVNIEGCTIRLNRTALNATIYLMLKTSEVSKTSEVL